MADIDNTRSVRIRTALTKADRIFGEVRRNSVKAEAVLTGIEQREARNEIRRSNINPRKAVR